MNLKSLLKGVGKYEIIGDDQQVIKGISIHSLKVKNDFLFVAIKGTNSDGHLYVKSAISNGAAVIVSDVRPLDMRDDVVYVIVKDVRRSLGVIADNYYDHPSKQIKCIGITGTNGKTSVATLLYNLFKELGFKVGLISTIEVLVDEEKYKAELTTPDVITLHGLLRQMVDADCTHVFMEVSSHAIHQGRISGLRFDGGVFTNISHDHLDYHGDFKTYIYVKQRFFKELDEHAFALSNIDDQNGSIMLEGTRARKLKYSGRRLADYKLKVLSEEMIGMHVSINDHQFLTRLSGQYNAYNLTAVFAVAMELLEIEEEYVIRKISGLKGAKGRMEVVSWSPKIIVDYAHTPDALDHLLAAIESSKVDGRLICVVGCGGDRDKAKRPKMAKIGTEYSDIVVFTSDNPRSEDPHSIIEDMMGGVDKEDEYKVLVIENRKSAIKTAIKLAEDSDIIVVAGKGHEEYQEINGEKLFFSDQQIVKDILSKDI